MALRKNPANAAVVLAVALGSRAVEMLAIHKQITHGLRAFGLAKILRIQVSCLQSSLIRYTLLSYATLLGSKKISTTMVAYQMMI